jgi:protein TonB
MWACSSNPCFSIRRREKKAGALAASFTLQTLGVGTLLLIPLVYTDRLNFVPPYLPVVLRLSPDPPAQQRPVHPQRHEARVAPPFFQAPARIPQLSTLSPIPDDAPLLNFGIGAPVPVSLIPQVGFVPHIDVAPPVVQSVAIEPPKRIILPAGVQQAKLIHKVVPVYPPLAKMTRVSGTVHLTGIIATDGTIRDLHVESGPPLLIQAALEAVRQWIYKPTLLSGTPVEVVTSISVAFTLIQ